MPYSRESAWEAQLDVRLDRVVALVLQRVRADLVAEADAAPFVTAQVHDTPVPSVGDQPHRRVELEAAVATHRTEHVSSEALGVHPDQHVLLARDLTA